MHTKSIIKKWSRLLTLLFFLLSAQALRATEVETTQTEAHAFLDTETKEHAEEASFGQLVMKMVAMLALTLTIFVCGTMLAKRYLNAAATRSSPNASLKVIEKKSISAKTSLYLVDVEGDRMLVVESPSGGQVVKLMRYTETKF